MSFEGFPVDYTAGGLLGLVVLLIVFGYLVPRWTVRQLTKPLEERIALQDDLVRELSTQNTELMEMARLGQSMYRALEEAAE